MSAVDRDSAEERFLVLAPTGRDGALATMLLENAGFAAHSCRSVDELCAEAARGASALLIAEEVLEPSATRKLFEVVASQESWSDLPVIIFTGTGATIQSRLPTAELLRPLGNVTLLERPVHVTTMLSTARAAARARHRQYEAREELLRQGAAVRQRDEFLAMLSHELRNPLSAILLAVELERPSPDGKSHLEVIRRQARHLASLVDDLLDVARVTTGKIVLRRTAVEVNVLVGRAARAFDDRGRDARVQIDFRGTGADLTVEGDPVRLEQIIGNLVNNAIKFTPAGGHVMLTVDRHDGYARVRVRDTGVGISSDALSQIFALFAQADRTLDRSQGGLGIGLTLVRSLVEMHGGRVTAESGGPGSGSEFTVYLPLAGDSAPKEASHSPAPTGASAPSHRILVVEDNVDARELLVSLLQSFGHEVDTASNGLDAVIRAELTTPDVALVDIGLPDLDGYGVARRIRSIIGDDLLLVAVTGYGRPEDRTKAFEAGFDVHYTKPVDAQKLQRLLARSKDALRQLRRVG